MFSLNNHFSVRKFPHIQREPVDKKAHLATGFNITIGVSAPNERNLLNTREFLSDVMAGWFMPMF